MIKTDDVVKFNNVIDLASLVKKIVLYTQLA
jgi:hypothetical protein